jgi:hypothetical protein
MPYLVDLPFVSQDRRVSTSAPATVLQSDINSRFFIPNSFSILECYEVLINADGALTEYRNYKYYSPMNFCGHWQISKGAKFDLQYEVCLDYGDMYCCTTGNGNQFIFRYEKQTDYNIALVGDKRPAVQIELESCNAYLSPAPVKNLFVNEQNALAYLTVLQKLYSGNYVGAAQDVVELTNTSVPGYRYPSDKPIFRGKAAVEAAPFADDGKSLRSMIGDLSLYLADGCDVASVHYGMEIVGSATSSIVTTYPAITECDFDVPGITQVPDPNSCDNEYEQFLVNNQAYRTEFTCNQAEGFRCISRRWFCTTNINDERIYWLKAAGDGG